MTTYCVDDRHGWPCPQPPHGDRCDACADEGCDPIETVEADNATEAARLAGWSEDYIADQWQRIDISERECVKRA